MKLSREEQGDDKGNGWDWDKKQSQRSLVGILRRTVILPSPRMAARQIC
jgi:hypothetical protein